MLPHRLLGATLYSWFRDTVLPIWQQHAIGMEPSSPLEIERELLEQSSQSALDKDDRLFYSVKISYISPSFHNSEEHEEEPVSENPTNPCFVGTKRMEKVLDYLNIFFLTYCPQIPIITQLREIETCRRNKRRRKSLSSNNLKTKCEANPLEDKNTNGFKYSNCTSCLCLYSRPRLVIFEDFRNRGDMIKGGLIFLFFSPKYAEQGIKVLHNLLTQHTTLNRWTSSSALMRTFCNIMTLLLFPTFSVEMDFFGARLFTNFREFIESFFSKSKVNIQYTIHEQTMQDISMYNHNHVDLDAIRNYSFSEQDYLSTKTHIEEFSIYQEDSSHDNQAMTHLMTIRLFTTSFMDSLTDDFIPSFDITFRKIKAFSTSSHQHEINRRDWLDQAVHDSTDISNLYTILLARHEFETR